LPWCAQKGVDLVSLNGDSMTPAAILVQRLQPLGAEETVLGLRRRTKVRHPKTCVVTNKIDVLSAQLSRTHNGLDDSTQEHLRQWPAKTNSCRLYSNGCACVAIAMAGCGGGLLAMAACIACCHASDKDIAKKCKEGDTRACQRDDCSCASDSCLEAAQYIAAAGGICCMCGGVTVASTCGLDQSPAIARIVASSTAPHVQTMLYVADARKHTMNGHVRMVELTAVQTSDGLDPEAGLGEPPAYAADSQA
jgi:hypothetical protein